MTDTPKRHPQPYDVLFFRAPPPSSGMSYVDVGLVRGAIVGIRPHGTWKNGDNWDYITEVMCIGGVLVDVVGDVGSVSVQIGWSHD